MSPWARASALDRHLACGAASWLPRADRGKWAQGYLSVDSLLDRKLPVIQKEDKWAADWGTAMHQAKENHPDAADPWLSWMDPHRSRLWPEGLGVHEQAWSYDCRTGLVVLHTPADGDKDEWKKSRGPSCVTGTTDWHAKLPGGEPWVDDLKTGYMQPSCTTPQMLCYALVASRVHEYSTVRISVTHWRRGWETPDRYWQQVGPATLDSFADELNLAWRRAQTPTPSAGTHCRYCPSAAICPTVTGES